APNRVRMISQLIRKLKASECRLLVKKVLGESQTIPQLKLTLFKFLDKRGLVTDFLTPLEIELIKGYEV
ncbi:MAG: hypothetical protein ABI778_12395, partial [Ignavibacteriota bacterium]